MKHLFFTAAFALIATTAFAATDLPKNNQVLTWTQAQRDVGFAHMERIVPARTVHAGGHVHRFGKGAALKLSVDVDAYMAHQRAVGLIVIHDNKIVVERYASGFTARDRWTSFSVAKSFTSTLAGAALKDGAIRSLDDKVTDYIPDLRGSAYDDVTVRQLLTMTSGVKWNEDYTDPNSDVAKFIDVPADPGVDVTVSYMRKLPRDIAPGSKWVYKTGETNLLGVLVSSATGKRLSDYLSEKIWRPYGMARDAVWMTGTTGHEISGCCISASLRDYARLGQFIVDGGRANGMSVLPDSWLAAATTKQAETGSATGGYGYQWWTGNDGTFSGRGIFGQSLFIDPKRRLVMVTLGDWPAAVDDALVAERGAFWKAVQAAVEM